MSIDLIINKECNGLELYFPQKPDVQTRSLLGDAKWRYHGKKKCWYARNTPENLALAHQVAGSNTFLSPVVKDESFFPAYDTVDGKSIFRSADISCWDHDVGYFADINAYVEVSVRHIVIKDLRDALIPGKECARMVLEQNDPYASPLLYAGLETFREVYDKFFIRRELPDCRVYESSTRSMKTFTPFKPIRPIRLPAKWTLPHVWKAILSGQIYQGWCTGRYTDDYAYDAAVNFHSGRGLHLPSFAKELIEDPSGWYVHPDKAEGTSIPLSVNCYSFNTNTLLFDADCDWPENHRRRNQREQAKTRHSAEMEAQ